MGLKRNRQLAESSQKTQLWVDAFLPAKSSEIIPGPSLDSFSDWMKRWKNKSPTVQIIELDAEPSKKKRRRHDSDEDYVDDNSAIDIPTTFVLSGPTGCGKTSIVHYFAKKHGFNVIEVSASDERSGSKMQKLLAGAMENQAVYGRGDIRCMFSPQRMAGPVPKQNLVLIDDVSWLNL